MKTAELVKKVENILGIELVERRGKYAYRANEVDQWFFVSRKDMVLATELEKSDDEEITNNLYSHWCQMTGTPCGPRVSKDLEAAIN